MVIRERKKQRKQNTQRKQNAQRKQNTQRKGEDMEEKLKNAKMLHSCVKVKCVDNKQKEKMWEKGGKGKQIGTTTNYGKCCDHTWKKKNKGRIGKKENGKKRKRRTMESAVVVCTFGAEIVHFVLKNMLRSQFCTDFFLHSKLGSESPPFENIDLV